jgi:hypothetical protein
VVERCLLKAAPGQPKRERKHHDTTGNMIEQIKDHHQPVGSHSQLYGTAGKSQNILSFMIQSWFTACKLKPRPKTKWLTPKQHCYSLIPLPATVFKIIRKKIRNRHIVTLSCASSRNGFFVFGLAVCPFLFFFGLGFTVYGLGFRGVGV